MSQIYKASSSTPPPSDLTINGDTGSVTGNPITFTGVNSGSTVRFDGSGSTMDLNVTDANENILIGSNAGNLTLSGTQNAAVGENVGASLTSGSQNSFFGSVAGSAVTSGTGNSLFGFSAGNSLTGGSYNTLLGIQAGTNVVSGNFNLLLGFQSGTNYTTTENRNILLSNPGVLGESNTIRIGAVGTHTETYLAGQVLAEFGTPSSPGYSFQSATNCGMLTDATNTYISGGGFATLSVGFNISLSGGTNTITQGVVKSAIIPKNANFTTAYNEYLYTIDTSSGAITGQLVSNPITGQEYIFKDNTNTWATNNFTLSGTVSGKNIDGASTLVGNVNGASITVIYSGVQWLVV